ncbi:MAG TPA: YbdK family carboxylate-amine ligase [Gaiellaceae bacterium]
MTIPHRFGESAPFSVGVEEELMIVDGESLRLVPRVGELMAEADGIPLKTELFASVVEATTGVHETAAAAAGEVASLRREAAEAAARLGLRIMAGGSHPISLPEEQAIVPEERYRSFVEYAGVSAQFQGVNGLHVHVGMPDPESCYRALEGVLPWLPVVLALSANSPYFAGRETGLLSSRAPVLAQLPRAGAPPAFGSYASWEAWVDRLGRLGVAADHTRIWWDLRPAPQFGTLEIRIPDQPTAVERSAALVELVVALCRTALDQELRVADRGDYLHNRWAAMRFGPAAELIHPDGDRVVLASELAADLGGCEAECQLEMGRASGLDAVCADLVERSLPS